MTNVSLECSRYLNMLIVQTMRGVFHIISTGLIQGNVIKHAFGTNKNSPSFCSPCQDLFSRSVD